MADKIMTSRGKPFSTRAYAEKNLPDGYKAVKQDGGWVGVKVDTHDVICPGCGQSYHDTTPAYDPDRNANAAMLRLKEKYREWGWDEIIPDRHSSYGCIVCPDCGAALAPSGRLSIR